MYPESAVSPRHARSAAIAHSSHALALALALLTLVASPGRAQVVLQGRVLDDSTGQPIFGARLLLLNRFGKTAGYQQTDSGGRFRFPPQENGRYRLEARAVGYRSALQTLLWMMEDRSFAGLEVRLTPHVALLAPVEVVALSAPSRSPVLANMEWRRAHGFGTLISRQEIEIRNPVHLTDILQETPGVRVDRQGSGATRRVIHLGPPLPGPGGGDCPVQIFVDGMLATRSTGGGDVTVDDLAQPQDVEAIEIFKGLASVPAEFLNPRSRCGVIAIWTKRSLP
jgi:hypothetical protein